MFPLKERCQAKEINKMEISRGPLMFLLLHTGSKVENITSVDQYLTEEITDSLIQEQHISGC